jgi:hypothetical protein
MFFLGPYVAHSAFKHAQIARSSDCVGVRRRPRLGNIVSHEPTHGTASDKHADSQKHVEESIEARFKANALKISRASKEQVS